MVQITIIKEKELNLLHRQLDNKNKMLDKACEMLEIGVYTTEKYLTRVKTLEEEKSLILNKIKELENTDTSENKKVKKAIPILKNVLDEYWNLNPKEKNDILKTIIKKIEYTKTARNTRWNKELDDLSLKLFLEI